MTLHHADHDSGRPSAAQSAAPPTAPSAAKDETVAAGAPGRDLDGDLRSDPGSDPAGGPDSGPGSDEVDVLVAAWRQERPDLDVEPLQVLSRVSRLARHLDRARRASFAEHDLETWEFDVLTALRRAGEPYELSPGALLRATLRSEERRVG